MENPAFCADFLRFPEKHHGAFHWFSICWIPFECTSWDLPLPFRSPVPRRRHLHSWRATQFPRWTAPATAATSPWAAVVPRKPGFDQWDQWCHDLMFGSSAKLQMSVTNSWLCGVLIGRKKQKQLSKSQHQSATLGPINRIWQRHHHHQTSWILIG